ncbi:MAG: VWA domain-containing protein [Halobacteriota archaeon]
MSIEKPISYPACATATEEEARLPDVRLTLERTNSQLQPRVDVGLAPAHPDDSAYLDLVLSAFNRDIALWASFGRGPHLVEASYCVILSARAPALETKECENGALAAISAGTVYFNYALFRDTIPLGFRLAVLTYIFGRLSGGQDDNASEISLDTFPVPLLVDQVKVLEEPEKYGFVAKDDWLERLIALLATKFHASPLPESARRTANRQQLSTLDTSHREQGAALTAEQLQYVEQFSSRNKAQKKLLLTKMRTLLSVLSTALGEDVAINVIPGEWWAYNPEENTITFPLIDLVTSSPEQIMGSIFHEIAHYQVTRVNANNPAFIRLLGTESKRLLLSAFEDPRATNWMLNTFPGTAPYLHRIYDDLLSEDLGRAPYGYKLQKEVQRRTNAEAQGYRLLPHLEYLLSVLYYWRFGRFPGSVINPRVKQALDDTTPFFASIFDRYPQRRAPEREKRRYAQEAAEQIVGHILEPYERLLEESQKNIGQTIERGQQPIGEGEDPSEMHPQTLEQEAQEIIEAQSKELADRLSAKNTSNQSLDAGGLEKRVTTRRDTLDGALISKEKPHAELTRQDLITQRRRLQSELTKSVEEYNRLYARVSGVLQPLVGTLENVLVKNRKPRYEGYYMTGQKPDVRKVMDVTRKMQLGLPTTRRDFSIFLKRRRPTHLDHRVMLLVDESGSMQEPKRTAVLEGVTLFAEALEYLEISYAVIGFADTPIIHKSFSDALSNKERIDLINNVAQLIPGGATADADALALGIELFKREPENVYRLMLIISDGEGNVNTTGRTFDELQETARIEGIRVLGIGIGEAADAVSARYSHPVQIPTVAELPAKLGEVLEQEVTGDLPHS